jgi:DNA-binding GntR family transcriptional regulator
VLRIVLSDGAIEQVETLVSELRAIRAWDAQYWRNQSREWYETIAFVSRQRRRDEIIRRLLQILTPHLNDLREQVVRTFDRTGPPPSL